MTLTIGVVIPCYKPHIPLLKRLFDSIENQTKKPDQVIVSCSSSDEADIPYRHEDYSFLLKIYTHNEKRNTAQNKNFGAKLIDTDIITFFDADDIMHPQRLEIIHKCFTENENIRLLIHSLNINPASLEFPTYDISAAHFEIDPFYVCNWGSVQLKNNSHRSIHNGHNAIRKNVLSELEYNETPEGHGREDTLFNATYINRHKDKGCIAYCELILTWYYPSGTHGIDISL